MFNAFHELLPRLGHTVLGPYDIVPTTWTTQQIPDLIIIAGLDREGDHLSAEECISFRDYHRFNSGKKINVVIRVNENDPRKGTTHIDDRLIQLSTKVDVTVFVSSWMQKWFTDKGWRNDLQAVIHNGVDKNIFKPRPELKLNNEKLNIVTHHWSSNAKKGADIYQQLDDLCGKHPNELAFTYIGRSEVKFKNSTLVQPLAGEELGKELSKHDVYVSASRWEPGPNHCLEGIATGLPTFVHYEGGGALDFVDSSKVYKDFERLTTFLKVTGDLLRTMLGNEPKSLSFLNSYKPQSWQSCVLQYNDVFERLT